jgi:hypothetical protein
LSDILRNVTFNTIYKAKSLALSKCLSFQRPRLYNCGHGILTVTFMSIKKMDVVHALLSLTHYDWLLELKSKNLSLSYFIQIVGNMPPIPYFNKVQLRSQFSCRKWGCEYVRAALHLMSVEWQVTAKMTSVNELLNVQLRN